MIFSLPSNSLHHPLFGILLILIIILQEILKFVVWFSFWLNLLLTWRYLWLPIFVPCFVRFCCRKIWHYFLDSVHFGLHLPNVRFMSFGRVVECWNWCQNLIVYLHFCFFRVKKKNKSLCDIFIAITKPFLYLEGALKSISQLQF